MMSIIDLTVATAILNLALWHDEEDWYDDACGVPLNPKPLKP